LTPTYSNENIFVNFVEIDYSEQNHDNGDFTTHKLAIVAECWGWMRFPVAPHERLQISFGRTLPIDWHVGRR